jgi:hypothetical protein
MAIARAMIGLLLVLAGCQRASYQGRDAESWAADLSDPDLRTRTEAAVALGRIGPAAVTTLPILLQRLETIYSAEESAFYDSAVVAVSKMGPASIPYLTEALHHEDNFVSMFAGEALRIMGPAAESAIPELVRALEPVEIPGCYDCIDETPGAATDALVAIGRPAVSALIDATRSENAAAREGALWALIRMAESMHELVPVFIEVLSDSARDASERWCATRGLAAVGADAGAAVAVLCSTLSDEEPACNGALYALQRMGAEAKDAIPALERSAKDPAKPEHWDEACEQTIERIRKNDPPVFLAGKETTWQSRVAHR